MRELGVKLGGCSEGTVYSISLDQSTQGELATTELYSYPKKLAEFWRKVIPWLSSQSRTLTLKRLLSSSRISYRRTPTKGLSLPARIFDDLLVCERRAYYKISRYKEEKETKFEVEKKEGKNFVNNLGLGEVEKVLKAYFRVNNEWVEIIGVPDLVTDDLVIEVTITRKRINYMIGRAIIYSYLAMVDGKVRSTAIVPITPAEEIGYLVVPSKVCLEYLLQRLEKVNEDSPGRVSGFCNHCLYRHICPYYE